MAAGPGGTHPSCDPHALGTSAGVPAPQARPVSSHTPRRHAWTHDHRGDAGLGSCPDSTVAGCPRPSPHGSATGCQQCRAACCLCHRPGPRGPSGSPRPSITLPAARVPPSTQGQRPSLGRAWKQEPVSPQARPLGPDGPKDQRLGTIRSCRQKCMLFSVT